MTVVGDRRHFCVVRVAIINRNIFFFALLFFVLFTSGYGGKKRKTKHSVVCDRNRPDDRVWGILWLTREAIAERNERLCGRGSRLGCLV